MNILTFSNLVHFKSHIATSYVFHNRYLSRSEDITNSFVIPDEHKSDFLNAAITSISAYAPNNPNPENISSANSSVNLESIQSSINYYLGITSSINPRIILDNLEPLSAIIADRIKVPRVSFLYPSYIPIANKEMYNYFHLHSIEREGLTQPFSWNVLNNPYSTISKKIISYYRSTFRKQDIDSVIGYMNPKTKLIPGIPTIFPIPNDIEDKESFFYTGPLFLEDRPSHILIKNINFFLHNNSSKKIVFFHAGNNDNQYLRGFVDCLLNKEYAVITNLKMIDSINTYNLFSNSLLPFNLVSKASDLVIHCCDLEFYYYPIFNLKPSITLGTQCYNKEMLALQLQRLDISSHVPHKFDSEYYLDIFIEKLNDFESETLVDYKSIDKLKDEMIQTMLNFDLEKMLNYTLNA